MNTVSKEKLHHIIDTIPEEIIPVVYKMINLLKKEYTAKKKKTRKKGSLAGIWEGSKIEDNLYDEAKKSIFPYENQ